MNKMLMLALPLAVAAAMGAPHTANAQGFCREYTRTVYYNDHVEQEHGTACARPDGNWDYFAQSYAPAPVNVTNVQYYPSPVTYYQQPYYQQPSTVFAFNFSNRRDYTPPRRDWDNHNWNNGHGNDWHGDNNWHGRR